MATEQEEFDRKSNQRNYNDSDSGSGSGSGSVPRPDPTILTTEALIREVTKLAESVDLKLFAANERLTAQVELTDSRFAAAALERDGLRTLILEKEIASQADREAIRDILNVRFAGILDQQSGLREMLNERYQTQTKALDAAFVAQQAAVATSFDASEKAMAAALLAAKEAVEKANVATEKRFDSVNELLSNLNTTLVTLLPRNEAEARMTALDARLTDMKSTVDKGFTATDVRSSAGQEHWGYLFGAIGLLIAIVVPVIVVLVSR